MMIRADGTQVHLASALRLCMSNRPTCPVCEAPTFGLLEGWQKHVRGHGLWTEAGYVRYRCAQHRHRRSPRYSLTVDGQVFQGERFAEIIATMRERGHSDDDVTLAAMIVTESTHGRTMTTEVTHGS